MNAITLLTLLALSQNAPVSEAPPRPPEGVERSPVSAWHFQETNFTGGVIPDSNGDFNLRLVKGGLKFTGDGETEAVLLDAGARELDLARGVDPSIYLPSEQFTIASWVRCDQPTEWAGIFSAIQDNGAYERGWASGINGDRFYLGLVGDEGDEKITYLFSDARAEPGKWYHFTATWDGRRMRLFVDGALDVESYAESGAVNWPPKTTIALGAYTDDDSRYSLIGALHSVELYDVALEPHEVATLFGRRAGMFPEPATPEDDIAMLPEETTSGWPTYRRDARRSAATDESLAIPLRESWRHEAPSRPRPSWPEPARSSFWQRVDEIVPRVVFDECFHPVSDGEVALYGSSSDDHVRCLDLATGAIRWTHATNGPVRFAPVIDGDGAIFASDDGTIRRVRLADGKVVWNRQLAPNDRRIVGNGRIISAWPPRTGPVLDRGLVSVTSGLFPRFGTWALTLDAKTGAERWRVPLPGISPQGYLLASPTRLFVPTGRTSPLMLGRGDGRTLGRFEGPGGTFAVLVENNLLTGPGSRGELSLTSHESRETVAGFDAEHGIVVNQLVILARGDTLTAIDRPRLKDILAERTTLERRHADLLARREQGEQLDAELEATAVRLRTLQDELLACELWRKELPAETLALADQHLVVGGHNEIRILDARTGKELWQHAVDGRALGTAIANGHLLVATDRGVLHTFQSESTSPSTSEGQASSEQPDSLPELHPELASVITDAGMDRGLALVVEPTDATLGLALAHHCRLHVVIIEEDPDRAASLRRRILETGMYGDAVAVLQADPRDLGVDSIANVVINQAALEDPSYKGNHEAISRLVRPAGGILIAGNAPVDELQEFDAIEGSQPRALQRRALEGAGTWTHPYANAAKTTSSEDTRLGGDFALQWFGGPGPERMVDRHLRTTASLADGGRLFVGGNDILIGMDAYNGMELWSIPLPGFTRTGAPYDGGWWALGPTGLFAAVGEETIVIDPHDGERVGRFEVPIRARRACGAVTDPSPRCEWGWLALDGSRLLGSASLPGTARLEQSRDAVVEQYSETEPLATSRALFSIDRPTGRTEWVYNDGVVVNSTIAVRDGRVIFLESRADPALEDFDGRVTLEDLRRGPLDLVALDLRNGRRLWRVPIDGERFDHSVFVALAPDRVVLVGCTNDEKTNRYHVAAHDPTNGAEIWRVDHANNREGTGGDHGEQVHHPVVLEDIVIAEPLAYDLETGAQVDPTGGTGFYLRSRSGCGTISASRSCLFFRDGNPAFLELNTGDAKPRKLTHASRQGCWVNIIPAQGMALIPESSSGCLCGYSLQTSLGLVPIGSSD